MSDVKGKKEKNSSTRMTRISETRMNTDHPEKAKDFSWDRIPFLSLVKADSSGASVG
jgi:hypothetical protein